MNTLREISRTYQLELAEVESEYWLIKSDYSSSDISESDLLELLKTRCRRQRPIKGDKAPCVDDDFFEDIFDEFNCLDHVQQEEERIKRIEREQLLESRINSMSSEHFHITTIANDSESDAEFAQRVGFSKRTIERLFRSNLVGEQRINEASKFIEKFHRRQSIFPTLKEAPMPRRVVKKTKRITHSPSLPVVTHQTSFI
jgi:hypothetical protein